MSLRFVVLLSVALHANPVRVAAENTHCGSTDVLPPGGVSGEEWRGYVCTPIELAPDDWGGCFRRSEYTDDSSRGCAGDLRCCDARESRLGESRRVVVLFPAIELGGARRRHARRLDVLLSETLERLVPRDRWELIVLDTPFSDVVVTTACDLQQASSSPTPELAGQCVTDLVSLARTFAVDRLVIARLGREAGQFNVAIEIVTGDGPIGHGSLDPADSLDEMGIGTSTRQLWFMVDERIRQQQQARESAEVERLSSPPEPTPTVQPLDYGSGRGADWGTVFGVVCCVVFAIIAIILLARGRQCPQCGGTETREKVDISGTVVGNVVLHLLGSALGAKTGPPSAMKKRVCASCGADRDDSHTAGCGCFLVLLVGVIFVFVSLKPC